MDELSSQLATLTTEKRDLLKTVTELTTSAEAEQARLKVEIQSLQEELKASKETLEELEIHQEDRAGEAESHQAAVMEIKQELMEVI